MIAMGALKCATMGPSVQGCAGVCSAFMCNGVQKCKASSQICTLWQLCIQHCTPQYIVVTRSVWQKSARWQTLAPRTFAHALC